MDGGESSTDIASVSGSISIVLLSVIGVVMVLLRTVYVVCISLDLSNYVRTGPTYEKTLAGSVVFRYSEPLSLMSVTRNGVFCTCKFWLAGSAKLLCT